jgi:S-adenosylmethionine-diacylgycerolhomoserine-N-methlytransferase
VSAALVDPDVLEGYYRVHARIYDATRWTFLFGRDEALGWLHELRRPKRILEVGCGTGRNLARLAELFPHAEIVGVDASAAMLDKAHDAVGGFGGRVQLREGLYGHDDRFAGWPDAIVMSYVLTMVNPGFDRVIEAARRDLAPRGVVISCDFHRTERAAFARWMARNHVRMDGHVLPELEARFEPLRKRVRKAFGGTWEYYAFVGKRG